MTRYDLAYLAITPPAAGYIAFRRWRQKKYRHSLPAMLGQQLDNENASLWQRGSIWVHAVSVGEVIAAKAMLPLLRQDFPGQPLLLTTHTETGQAQAKQLEGEFADAVRYFPFDYSWVVRRFAEVYQPKLFLPMETEFWPNTLDIFAEHGTQTFVLNGKISERSFGRYARVRPLIRGPLSRVTAFCMQTEADAQRVKYLTTDAVPTYVTGNCKFDNPTTRLTPDEALELRRICGIRDNQPVVVVGSTHPGEEQIVLDAWQQVQHTLPGATMLLVPRHPERFNEVWQMLCRRNINTRRASNRDICGSDTTSVVLVDEMGILAKLYGIASVAVVAGSFVEGIGGHNLQEAAAHKVPVIRGPYMRKQPDMVGILTQDNGGIVANGTDSLAHEIIELLQHPDVAREKGNLAYEAFERNRGSAQRNMEVIRKHLK